MSLIILAKQLDALTVQANAHINESDESVTVSNLSADATLGVLRTCSEIGWEYTVFDEEQTPTDQGDIVDDFEPFRVVVRKPSPTKETLDILTSVGFLTWLEKGHDASCWRIAGLSKPLITQLRVYIGWVPLAEIPTMTASLPTKSPRILVRESGVSKSVPEDIRQWLLVDQSQFDLNELFHEAWAEMSFNALIHALANEIDSVSQSLVFKGPPKLILQPLQSTAGTMQEFGGDAFLNLQSAVNWVYENGREAEVKHSLLAAEIARSGRESGSTVDYFKANLSTALESAKIAYQMSLSELGKETLKSLGDLRKAITEETSKATDATRQTITAVSGALAVGVGLVAARVNTGISPWLISMLMLIATGYIGMVIYSGWSFICLQRELRRDWQPKLYRFLPENEYEKMVAAPAKKAEQVFRWSAIIGMGSVVLMLVGILVFSFFSEHNASAPKHEPLESRESQAKAVISIQLSEYLSGLKMPHLRPLELHKEFISPLLNSVEPGEPPAKL